MSDIKTSVNLCGVELKNPVMTASGTFGSGAEYCEFVDLNKLGAVVTKGVANIPWAGNPTPRVAEVSLIRFTLPFLSSVFFLLMVFLLQKHIYKYMFFLNL